MTKPSDTEFFLDDLTALLADAPELPTVEIDLSEEFGRAGAKIVLRQLDVPKQYRLYEDAETVKEQCRDFTTALCQNIAMLALAHVSPKPRPNGKSITESYICYARNERVWAKLLGTYATAFPGNIPASNKSVQAAGND